MTTKNDIKTIYKNIKIYSNPANSYQIILPSPYGSYVGTVSALKRIIDRYFEYTKHST